MKLNAATSAYLDLLRFIAALAVLLGHMEQDGLYMAWMPLARFSHEAVIVFFVMSGFIIYSTTVQKNRGVRDYLVARAARIYSVALPAVAFSLLAALLVPGQASSDPNLLSNYRPWSAWDVVSSLLFLNESWGNQASLTMNNPYWSLCYEVWYYALFGAFFFFTGQRRWWLTGLFSVLAGPAVLILFPVWLLGVWLAQSGSAWPRLRVVPAWVMFFASLLAIVVVNLAGIDAGVRKALIDLIPGFWRLESSVLIDYAIGGVVLFHLHASWQLGETVEAMLVRARRLMAHLAGFSFTLYLFHRPMTLLSGHYFPNTDHSVPYAIGVAACILFICWAISMATERPVHFWRACVATLLPRH